MIGKRIKAKIDMVVNDIEDDSIPPLHIKVGDIGVIKGKDYYPGGIAWEVEINNEEIFLYKVSSNYWEEVQNLRERASKI